MLNAVRIFAFVVANLVLNASAFAASALVKLDKAELRLLDGGKWQDGTQLVGIEIKLSAGVKTYWRMPGDSGLPPIFDFSLSQNVEKVDIRWPRPARFVEADGTILGFQDRVIFPVIVTPKNKTDPVSLAVTIDFGLCDTLCLPAKAELALPLSGNGPSQAKSDIESFLARVPKISGVQGSIQPSLQSGTFDGSVFSFRIASDTPLSDVILEAQGSWFFGMATIRHDGGRLYMATIPIEQKPKSASIEGLALTVTAIAGDAATETAVTLDASGSIR